MTIKTTPPKTDVVLTLSDGALEQVTDYANQQELSIDEAIESLLKKGVSSTKQAVRRRIRGDK